MVFSKKLVGGLAVAAALAFAPAAGAAPTGPGNGLTAPTTAPSTPTSPSNSIDQRAICLYWYYAAEAANDEYWLSVDFPEVEWETPDGDDVDLEDLEDIRDEQSANWSAFYAAVQEYERRNCDEVLGRPAPELERR